MFDETIHGAFFFILFRPASNVQLILFLRFHEENAHEEKTHEGQSSSLEAIVSAPWRDWKKA